MPQRVGRRIRRVRRRRRTQRCAVRRRARHVRVRVRDAVRRAVRARLAAQHAEHHAEAVHLRAQRLDPLVLRRNERLELVDLRKLDRVARAPLEQLGVQLVALATQAHNVRVARTQLLLQLVAVCVGLRRRLVLELDAELAQLLVLVHDGGTLGAQALRLVLQQHHIGLRLVEQGVRRDALVGQRRKLRRHARELLLQRADLGTQLAQLLEPRRSELALRHELLLERGVRRAAVRGRRVRRVLAPLGLGTLRVRRGNLRRLGVRTRLAERILDGPHTCALAPVCGLLRGTQRLGDARGVCLRGRELRVRGRERGTQRARLGGELCLPRLGVLHGVGRGGARGRVRRQAREHIAHHVRAHLQPARVLRSALLERERRRLHERRLERRAEHVLVDMQRAQHLTQRVPELVHALHALLELRDARLERVCCVVRALRVPPRLAQLAIDGLFAELLRQQATYLKQGILWRGLVAVQVHALRLGRHRGRVLRRALAVHARHGKDATSHVGVPGRLRPSCRRRRR